MKLWWAHLFGKISLAAVILYFAIGLYLYVFALANIWYKDGIKWNRMQIAQAFAAFICYMIGWPGMVH